MSWGGPSVDYENVTCRTGANRPSKDSAVRTPVPVTMKTIELPEVHPVRFTISCMTPVSPGVCWSDPWAPTVPHGAGTHVTSAEVREREEMLFVVFVNVPGLSAAWPSMSSDAAPVVCTLHWNWM